MRHPFDGINKPPTEELSSDKEPSTRRSVLARTLAAAAGIAAVFLGRGASAQRYLDRRPRQPTTYALGEEGGGTVTTYALGEEGGGPVTTYALGEEGGGPVTTYALGEEGGGQATTQAIGEEGGWQSARPRRGVWGHHPRPRR